LHFQVYVLVQSIHHSMSVLQSWAIPEIANIKLYLNPSQLELSKMFHISPIIMGNYVCVMKCQISQFP
jgi:hypothetical protein